MALVTLTALQAKAVQVIITQAIDALARYEMIKNYSDEQCQVLIDASIKTKESLDERLAKH